MVNWISVKEKLPDSQWIEQMSALRPDIDWSVDCDSVLIQCLVNWADVNYGHVDDCEVGVLMYTKRDGWMFPNWVNVSEDDIKLITHWMPFPDPVKDNDAQIVFDIV